MGGGRIEWEEGGVGCTTQRICVKITSISLLLPIGME